MQMYSDKSMKETETISIANQNQENEMEFRLCVRACQPLLLLIPSNVCQIKRNDPATSGDEMQKTNKTLIVCVEWNCCPIPTYTQSVFSQGELSHELSKKTKNERQMARDVREKKARSTKWGERRNTHQVDNKSDTKLINAVYQASFMPCLPRHPAHTLI